MTTRAIIIFGVAAIGCSILGVLVLRAFGIASIAGAEGGVVGGLVGALLARAATRRQQSREAP